MMLACGGKSYFGLAEITSYVFLISFKDGGRKVSPSFHLFVLDVNQGDEEAGGVQDFLAWSQRFVFCTCI